jgi:signal transduction histidine kinase/ligand-binding sensor domain-containing protein
VVTSALISPGAWLRALPLLAIAMLAPAVGAVDTLSPAPNLRNYHHTRWTAEEGAPQAIRAMAQTADGWLWLGTMDGLYRFDGVQFSRYPLPPGLGLNRNMIRYLHAGSRGELYMGRAAEGMSVLHPDGRLQDLPPAPDPGAMIDVLSADADGSVWMVSKGVYRLEGDRWLAVQAGEEWDTLDVRGFLLDGQGQLWISRDNSIWRLDRQTRRFARILDKGGDLLRAPDGRLWLISGEGEMQSLTAGASTGRRTVPRSPEALGTGQFSDDGALWVLDCPGPPCVVPGAARHAASGYKVGRPAGAPADATIQMSGKTLTSILVDREGATWVTSEGGIDRFRPKRVVPTELDGEGVVYSTVADGAGRMWAANALTGKMWQLLPERAVPVEPRHPVTVLGRDPAGALLLGGKRSIWRHHAEGAAEIPLPPGADGKPMDRRLFGILDDGKVLWTAAADIGLIGWQDGKWQPGRNFSLPAKIYQSALAGPGQMWLATGNGELFHYDLATDATRPPIDIRALGMTAAIFPEKELVLSGDNGTGVVQGGVLRMLHAPDASVLRNVSGFVVTADGDRWLNGAAGLVHVTAKDWKRSIDNPDLPLNYEVFNALDGYPGRAVIESRWRSAWTVDGRTLWLVATGGVMRVDSANLKRNLVAPTPLILSLSSDKVVFTPGSPDWNAAILPPGTERLRVDFTAPSLRMPERVRFEYLLEGIDSGWQDAGTRRTTSYTNVKPGNYVFRLHAINEDGKRSATQAVLRFTVEPTIWQTTWFKLFGMTLIAALLFLAYRYRVRYLTRRVAERMHVKMAERERIARTLHDTFLQTVQSLVFRVDAIAAGLPKDAGARGEIEQVLGHARRALGEGREQLQELRSVSSEQPEDLLEDSIAELREAQPGIAIGLRTSGLRRRLAVGTGAEVAAIAREALHNACAHAAASHVDASLEYQPERLVLTVTDDGRGIDAAVLHKGAADGRWGLVGMRERADRIGGILELESGSSAGTVVRLTVPGVRAYAS